MNKKIQNILFASDLSVDMKPVFEQAVAMATYTGANLIVLHVMEEASPSAQRQVQMAFGKNLYEEIRAKHKSGAQDLLIGKNVDALRIRQAIAGFSKTGKNRRPMKRLLSKKSWWWKGNPLPTKLCPRPFRKTALSSSWGACSRDWWQKPWETNWFEKC